MRKNMLTAVAATVLAGSLAMAAPATAAVLVDSYGVGFVGKGDVQLAFGWNNQLLQDNASGITFTLESEDVYTAVCEFVTGEGTRGERTHRVPHTESTTVNSSVAYHPRIRNQITGFNLTGTGATTSTGSIPVVGEACPGNPGHEGIWSSVLLTDSSGGLYVHHGVQSVLLPQ